MSNEATGKMADTPVTRSKKRTIDESPPKAGEPYMLLSPGGTETPSSPQETQDPKKRVVTNAKGKDSEETEDIIPLTPLGQGRVTSKMAAPTQVNKTSNVGGSRDGDNPTQYNPVKVNENGKEDMEPPARGRTVVRRGRPRKRGMSLEPIVDKGDLMSAIMGIRGDIGTVTENQHALKGEMITSLNLKINELKLNLCEQVKETTGRVSVNEVKIDELTVKQDRLHLKVQDTYNRQDEFVSDLRKQKQYVDDINLALSDQIGTVELGLAQDIETLKGNVEKGMADNAENHVSLEEKLRDFTVELDIENARLKMDMDAMKSVVDKLHKKNIALDQLAVRYESKCDSCPRCSITNSHSNSHSSIDTSDPNSHASSFSEATSDSERSNSSVRQTLHMFGDTSKSVIVSRVMEKENENLREVMLHCFNDINLNIEDGDIENVDRIGLYDKNQSWPRPVKILFTSSAARDQVLYFKLRLRHSAIYHEFKISKEEPKELRVNRAKLRQAANIARENGHKVIAMLDRVIINDVEYNHENIDTIPQNFRIKTSHNFEASNSLLTFEEKCRFKSGKIISVGPSLQKTKRGLAFCSEASFLSNFYRCNIVYRGETYICLEQAYQARKAMICSDSGALKIIMETDCQVLMKITGQKITTTTQWDNCKLQVMEELLFCKFRQNLKLYYLLLNTRPHKLIESTLDNFWGAGCKIGTIALEEGIWIGKNHLGQMLVYVRDILARENEGYS